MPRTVDEILQHADELAARFESYEPNPDDELDAGAVALLRAAVAERSEAERHVIDAIRAAREAGKPWDLAKNFEGAAVLSGIVPKAGADVLQSGAITLQVNGLTRQSGIDCRP